MLKAILYNLFRKKIDILDINIIIITDTHNHLTRDLVDNFLNVRDVDCIITLGDISYNDWDILIDNNRFLSLPKYALLGNHDDYIDIESTNKRIKNKDANAIPIINIDNRIVNINGLSILGIEGSIKYKNNYNSPLYTQYEILQKLNDKPKADIIFSHDKPKFEFDDTNTISSDVHNGLYGIYKYMKDTGCNINIHGHIHKQYIKKIRNKIEISCYKLAYISIKNGKINIINI